jgi:membrane fusion protein, multidrug efflux system
LDRSQAEVNEMNLFRQLIVVVVIGVAATAVWLGLGPMFSAAETATPNGKRDSAAAVLVQSVTDGVERIRVEAVGNARASLSATLFPATAGEVQAINFTSDQPVSRGDVLVELDRETEQLAVELAQVRVADAERIFRRLQSLIKSGATAQSSLDDARTNLEAARIEQKRSEVALADRFVVAPFSGRIGLTELDVGDRIDPETEIATLDDRSTLLVRFDVPEVLLGRVAIGDPVAVTPWASNGDETTGRVSDVGSRVSEQTRTFTVRAAIPNETDSLRPGMSFRVVLDVEGARYPKVPEIAIQWGGEGSFVWAIQDGTAQRIPVLIVQRQQAEVLVDGAIEPGTPVVIEGLHRMRPGSKVEIIAEAGSPEPAIPARLEGTGS